MGECTPGLTQADRASPDEVKITREGDYAVIAYADPSIATTHFPFGEERLARMTDAEVLDVWNEDIEARDEGHARRRLRAARAPRKTADPAAVSRHRWA
jgi:hypothetical protein